MATLMHSAQYATLILSHWKFTTDELPLTSDSGCTYIRGIHLVAIVNNIIM